MHGFKDFSPLADGEDAMFLIGFGAAVANALLVWCLYHV